MIYFSIFFVLGVWSLQQQATLPDPTLGLWVAALLPALLLPINRSWQRITRLSALIITAFVAGFFYAAWMAQQRLSDALPAAWQGKDIVVTGIIAEMPKLHERGLSFTFDLESVGTSDVHVPRHLLLSTYRDEKREPLALHAGERWQFTVRLKQPHGTSNPYNFDFEAWALERDIRAVGYVHGKGDNRLLDARVASPTYLIERLRESVRMHFKNTLGDPPYAGVLSALAIGDQASIPAAQWQVFTRTGVNHLMSISGLHITMLAGFAFACTYWLWRRSARLTLWLPARKVAALVGFVIALAYALLAGYGVPAQRTVYMLATVAVALWSSRNIAPSQLLAAAAMVVLLFDPWAVISPGFWLSFGAVALIFYVTANRLGARHWLIEYSRVQWAMSIGLIPLLLALFQQVSLVSPLANAFAIPLVSFVVVPLTLLGALLPLDGLLQLAHQSMDVCMQALEWLNGFSEVVWTQHAPPVWSIIAGMLGILWMLLPSGFPARWIGALILLPMFLSEPDAPSEGTMRLYVFDVGQGLAVAAQTQNHALLYDTGSDFNGDADSGNRILIPALRGLGIAELDGLMLTHDDNDHTGGAASIIQAMPIQWLSSSLAPDSPLLQNSIGQRRCVAGQSWQWDGVSFEVLHPNPRFYANEKLKDNDLGCVLKITTGQQSVLLAADIEKKSEQYLLETSAAKLATTILIVPHHGSKTSSTPEFIAATHPKYAVFTVGYRNRFRHPHEDIVARYRAIGSELVRSDESGMLTVHMDAHGLQLERYRDAHHRYWHHENT